MVCMTRESYGRGVTGTVTREFSGILAGLQDADDRADESLAGLGVENGDLSDHQLPAGGEQLARPRVAVGTQRARVEARRGQVNRPWIAVGIAGDLAENPVVSTGIGQGNGRTQLRLREIREGERDEDYPSGCRCDHAASSSGRLQSASARSLMSAVSSLCSPSSRMVTSARRGPER